MPTLKLSLEDFEIESDELLAIAVHSPGSFFYQLAYSLNKKMAWTLTNFRDPYLPPENPQCALNVLSHVDSIARVQYLLVENRSAQQYWIPKMPDVDYWILIVGAGLDTLNIDNLLHRLSETEYIFSAAFLPLDPPSLGGRKSPLFKYFQSFYDYWDYRELIQRFD
ncbi:MAG: hypothetical protein NC048_01340 [Bacteroides sp.]|nr:hypothetical protein [Ruminococcus flavefaciens]MCM1554124.1 hypothetical protein [Bacteroides sp.]